MKLKTRMAFSNVALVVRHGITFLTPTVSSTPCYNEYLEGNHYDSGSTVSVDGINYQCVDNAYSLYCKQFKPPGEFGSFALMAWSSLGICSGSLATEKITSVYKPTRILNLAGCPRSWEWGGSYTGGDRVSVENLVFECDAVAFGHCPYRQPGKHNPDESWHLLGSCEGIISPTAPPTVNHNAPGCPHQFQASKTYIEGDKVSVGSTYYECKKWPFSVFCSVANFEPNSANGDFGWMKLGSCDGTISPTASPTHSTDRSSGDCSRPYSIADLDTYVSGVRVEYNNFVFECKSDIHISKYCKWSAYGPDGTIWNNAWNKIGWCNNDDTSQIPSFKPSLRPSSSAVYSLEPSSQPSTSDAPSLHHSLEPSVSSDLSLKPSESQEPSNRKSFEPSQSGKPSIQPSLQSSTKPSIQPSAKPSFRPSKSSEPSYKPSLKPSTSVQPSAEPSLVPSFQPSVSNEPSFEPSFEPSQSGKPSIQPSLQPSTKPSIQPSAKPSFRPSKSSEPSFEPSLKPSASVQPSIEPSLVPSFHPSLSYEPSFEPSFQPSASAEPSFEPSLQPSTSAEPSMKPSVSVTPSFQPSVSSGPSSLPSASCGNLGCQMFENFETCPNDCANIEFITPNYSDRNAPGVLFTIAAKRNITIQSFSISASFYVNTGATSTVRIYTRLGGYTGYTGSSDGWEKIYDASVYMEPYGTYTNLGELGTDFTVNEDEERSFFIYSTDIYLGYALSTSEFALYESDDAIDLFQGRGMYGEFDDATIFPRSFHGKIKYDIR